MFACQAYQVEIGIHDGGRVGGLWIITRCPLAQHVEGDKDEAVGIVAQRNETIVREDDDGVEDGP